MVLRIVAGFLKGRVIRIPDKGVLIRPTLERTRISIAAMIEPRLGGAVCADLCAGSGAFGFEMLSRGAASVDFVEKDPACTKVIRVHACTFGVLDRCRIVERDVTKIIASGAGPYGVIFFDPPYDNGILQGLVGPLLGLLDKNGILLYQRRKRSGKHHDTPEDGPQPFDTRRYGDTVVESYRVD
jgi:16S rRNA (guanine966-N2)-methyltransferase